MSQNPLAHLQRKKPPQSFHEKHIQLPYMTEEEEEEENKEETKSTPLEIVPSKKPVLIDKTNEPYDRKRILEALGRKGVLKVKPSLREVPREPFPVVATEEFEPIPEEEEEEDIRPVLEREAEARTTNPPPQAIPLPVVVPKKKLRGKKEKETETGETEVPPKNLPKKGEKPPKRIENWITEKETVAPTTTIIKPITKPVIHRISTYYLNNRKKFLTEINRLFSKYRSEMADKEKDISCQTQKEKGAFELMTHQKVITDYLNLYSPYRGLLLYHGLGTGKCHKKDTPLIMYDGSIKKIQDIRVGELLMGDDSKPRKVLSLARGRDVMYDVIPSTNTSEKYTVNREHILCLKAVEYPSNTNQDIIEISIENYLKLSHQKKGELKGYQTAVEFPEKPVPIDAYFIGYWIGEFFCRSSEITCKDSVVLEYLTRVLEKHQLSLKLQREFLYEVVGNGYDDFLALLVELHIIKIKHIPLLYKCNSRANRLKLLAGILDSHGKYEKGKDVFELSYKVNSVNGCKIFMDDIIYLVRSLGFVCCYEKGNENENGMKKILIYGLTEEVPIRIPSKKPINKAIEIIGKLDNEITVKALEEDDYFGFTLDGNGRYLLGDFTVTHNTCSSIALAEGMKSEKKIFVLTPASLKVNYFNELKSCGDQLYRIHQHWEFISTADQPDRLDALSETLQLPREMIEKQKGAWMMNPSLTANYEELNAEERHSLDAQVDAMIHTKYEDIHYNGLNSQKIKELEDRGKRALPRGSKRKPNPFHDSVVVVDEAHNLVSRIHNQLKSNTGNKKTDKNAAEKGGAGKGGVKIALKLYEWLMTAENARVILLSGTPIINYPSEIAVMFNILRGTIKTWTFALKIETQMKVDKDSILTMFERAGLKTYDYVAYSRNELVITRNPFGFVNKKRGSEPVNAPRPPQAVKRLKTLKNGGKDKKGKRTRKSQGVDIITAATAATVATAAHEITHKETEPETQNIDVMGGGVVEDNYEGVERSYETLMTDDDFEKGVTEILNSNGLIVEKGSVRVQNNLLLPDNQEEFFARFVDIEDGSLKNEDILKRRILGLTSYFRSAQEKLMPSFVLTSSSTAAATASVSDTESESDSEEEEDGKQMGGMITTNRIYHLVKIPMSSYQFGIYEKVRKEEANQEKNRRKRAKNQANNEDSMDSLSSSYRIFSRVACNFVFPPPGRPMPPEKEGKKETTEEKNVEVVAKKTLRKGGDEDSSDSESDKEQDGGAPAMKSMRMVSQMEIGNEDELLDDDMELDDGEEEGAPEDKETSQKAYQRAIQTALALLKNKGDQFLSLEALKDTYSPKMAAIIERLQDPVNRGLHLIYSQFRSLEGIQVMKLALEQNGWAEFRIERGTEGWQIDWDVERHGEWKTNTKPCFVLYTGTETAEVKEIIRNVYNGKWTVVPPSLVEQIRLKGEDNRFGEVIKAFMITSSGAEGISLTNTRFVHIMEPYWNLVRLEQVIGRARRICSHEELPVALRTVKVFLYLSVLSQEQSTSEKHIELRIRDLSKFDHKTPVTTDEYLLEVALLKDSINRQILTAIQSTAIDCSLYADTMNEFAKRSGEEALVCYGFGKVTSNAFSMYPTLEEDLTKGQVLQVNERREKVAVVEFRFNGEEYVKNMKNNEIYTRANYNRGLENGEDLVVVGKMIRDSNGKEQVQLGQK